MDDETRHAPRHEPPERKPATPTARDVLLRPRALVTVLAVLVAGLLLGIGVTTVRKDSAPPPPFDATGRLATLPPGPVEVIAETVRLGHGFTGRHEHGGPTFNFVASGRVRIVEDDGGRQEFGPGAFFFEPAGRPHTIEVLSDARLDVLRLLPPGVSATTDLPRTASARPASGSASGARSARLPLLPLASNAMPRPALSPE